VRASFGAYESLWRARGDQLASVSLILSRLPTFDQLSAPGWAQSAIPPAKWGDSSFRTRRRCFWLCAIPAARYRPPWLDPRARADYCFPNVPDRVVTFRRPRKFPAGPRHGFVTLGDRLYQIVITQTVYVHQQIRHSECPAWRGCGDADMAPGTQERHGGSDFVFWRTGGGAASTLVRPRSAHGRLRIFAAARDSNCWGDYPVHFSLSDVDGNPGGELPDFASLNGAEPD